MNDQQDGKWERRYQEPGQLFAATPSPLLLDHQNLFDPTMRVLVPGDGEGRNGVWLAKQGLDVTSVEISSSAVEKARAWATKQSTALNQLCGDVLTYPLQENEFDAIVLIFVHLPRNDMDSLLDKIQIAARPGGYFFFEGFHQDNLTACDSGPRDPDMLFTLDQLERRFSTWQIKLLTTVDTQVEKRGEFLGKGIAIHFIAQKPL